MFKIRRLPDSIANLVPTAATAIIRSSDMTTECVRLDDIPSERGAALLACEIIQIPIYGSRVPDSVYALCRRIRATPCPLWRMEPAVLLIILNPPLPDGVDADLRGLGCD